MPDDLSNDEPFEVRFAAQRSHQDASAANAHTSLLDQWLLTLNGAAAIAILTFASTAHVSGNRLYFVAISLACFGFGASTAAMAMRAHSWALYEWLYFWSLRAGISDNLSPPNPCEILEAKRSALRSNAWHDWFYRLCVLLFLAGCLSFAAVILMPDDRPKDDAIVPKLFRIGVDV